MGILKKLRSPKVLYGIGMLILAIPIGLFLYNKSVDWRGEELTAALEDVDLTIDSFSFEINEFYDIPRATGDDLTPEGRAVMQAYVDALAFDREATQTYNPMEYRYAGGGDQFYLRVDLEEGFLSVGRWGRHMRVQLEEGEKTVAVGLFTYGKDEYKDIFALFGKEK